MLAHGHGPSSARPRYGMMGRAELPICRTFFTNSDDVAHCLLERYFALFGRVPNRVRAQ
jgi:hypothetical protein